MVTQLDSAIWGSSRGLKKGRILRTFFLTLYHNFILFLGLIGEHSVEG